MNRMLNTYDILDSDSNFGLESENGKCWLRSRASKALHINHPFHIHLEIFITYSYCLEKPLNHKPRS